MFCPGCGVKIEQTLKFCRGCGLPLTEHARLLEFPEEPELKKKRNRREMRLLDEGFLLLLLSSIISFCYWIFTYVLATPHLQAKDKTILQLNFLLCLVTFGLALLNLRRGGLFARLAKRFSGASASTDTDAAPKRQVLPTNEFPKLSEPRNPVESVSISEHTTRELQPQPGNSGSLG